MAGWQYSDSGSFPYYGASGENGLTWGFDGSGLDMNLFKKSWLEKTFGESVEEQPEEPPLNTEPGLLTVTANKLFVRSGPGRSYPIVGELIKGEQVDLLDISGRDVWLEIEPGKFSAYRYQGEQLMKLN
jgi:uncharacterized protein YgiM (DUF1202 family)